LAKTIASKDNPLTARVMVNRVWQYHFGTGLVRTPGDFGTRGEKPTHPELLDWLAVRFANDDGWSMKKLHRRIMLRRLISRLRSTGRTRERSIRRTNCSGGRIRGGWISKRCAIRCSPRPARST
jgi:hypothetical protein